MPAFAYDPQAFSLDDTLACGQAFRWTRLPGGAWRGVVAGSVITLRREGARLAYETAGGEDAGALLWDLFLLEVDLPAVRAALLAADPSLAGPLAHAPGLRLMRQDPEECLLSFVCSTANNVPRIVAGIRRLSAALGRPLAVVDAAPYHAFPTLPALAEADPAWLQAATGLGYRAERLVRVAQQLLARGPGWLPGLRAVSYAEAHAALLELYGIGPKVADCACLFSLDHPEAVPVDTHIRQVAQSRWGADDEGAPRAGGGRALATGLTAAAYRRVGDAFRVRYGRRAGYAQNWLFYDHFRGYWGGTSPLLKPDERG